MGIIPCPAMVGRETPSRLVTLVWARAASLRPKRWAISSSVLARGIALSKSAMASSRLPRCKRGNKFKGDLVSQFVQIIKHAMENNVSSFGMLEHGSW